MRIRIAGHRDDGALGPILRLHDVAFRIVAVEVIHPIGQSVSKADHRRDKLGVDGERVLEKTDGGVTACLGVGAKRLRPSTHGKIDCVRIVRPLAHRAQGFGLDELHPERVGKAGDELDLQLPQLAAVAVEPVGPHMGAGLGRDELGVDRDRLAEAAHAAFEHVAHAKFASNLLRVHRLAFIGEGRVAGDDEAALQMREIGGQIVGDAIGEIVLLLVAAQILERQHDDGEARRIRELIVNGCGHEARRVARAPSVAARSKKRESERSRQRRPPMQDVALPRRPSGRSWRHWRAVAQQISTHRLGDVLEALQSKVGDLKFEPRLDLPVGVLGQANPARLADAFEARSNVDAVAHQIAVLFLDHVAEVDAHAKLDAALRGQASVALNEAVLHFDCAAHRRRCGNR